ncbi:MAG: dTDP-4-dehydrorhamnose reductase, partial [Chitinispirillia bacterium]
IDISDNNLTKNIIIRMKPEIIINCAAYTAVDLCETNQKEAFSVNSKGIENIAYSAKIIDAKVIHISTDYVFDGLKDSPYVESDMANPQTIYGKSKLEGEKRLSDIMEKYFIFRIAWLYGIQGSNFVKTIYKSALINSRKNLPLKVVNDQFGSPTYTKDVCEQILSVIKTANYGLFHCTNEGRCSWYEFAQYIIKLYKIHIDLIPCSTEEFQRLAKRPLNSVLENQRLKTLNLNIMSCWKTAFNNFFEISSENLT